MKLLREWSLILIALILLPTVVWAAKGLSGGTRGISGTISLSDVLINVTGGVLGNYPVDAFNSHHDGVTDDSQAINLALAACSAGGGGLVSLGPYRYWVSDADITVPTGCMLYCPIPQTGTHDDPNFSGEDHGLDVLKLKFAIAITPAHSVILTHQSGWAGCNLVSANITINPNAVGATPRDQLNMMAQFAGTGFTVTSTDTYIYNAFIGGFNQAVLGTPWPARLHMSNVSVDSINGIKVSNCHDICRFDHVEMYAYMARGPSRQSWPIVNVSDDGSGQYLVEINPTPFLGPATVIPQNGDYVWVDSSIRGAESLYAGRYVADVVDATHVKLTGSKYSQPASAGVTVTGDTTAGSSTIRNMSSNTNLGTTGTVVAPGVLPDGAIIRWISQDGTMIGLNKPALVDSTGTSFSYHDNAWQAGTGKLWLNASYRQGTAFEFDTSEGIVCYDCFAFSWRNGFYLRNNDGWFQCSNCSVDGTVTAGVVVHEPQTTAFVIEGSSGGHTFTGGATSSVGTVVWIKASGTGTGNGPASFVGMNFNNAGNLNGTPMIEVDSGPVSIVGVTSAPNGRYTVVKDAATQVLYVGNNNKNFFGFESITAVGKVLIDGNFNRTGGPSPSWGGVETATSGAYTANVVGRGHGYTPGDLILPDIDSYLSGNVIGLNPLNLGAELIAAATSVGTGLTLVSGGSGCTDGTVTLTGTTGVGPTKFTATAVSSGGVLQEPITIVDGGVYTTNPTNLADEPVTAGTCTGARVNLNVTLGAPFVGSTTVMGARYAQIRNTGTYTLIKPGQTIRITDKNYTGNGQAATIDLGFAAMAAGVYPRSNVANIGCYQCTNLGFSSLSSWTAGGFNTAIGWIALRGLTTGSQNVAVGGQAAAGVTTGTANTIVGTAAMSASTTATNNTVMGAGVMGRSLTGLGNIAIGINTLLGDAGLTSIHNNNIAIGFEVMRNLAPGTLDHNIGIGEFVGDAMTTADHNIMIGDHAGFSITTGSDNIILNNNDSGGTLTTGSRNILIGTGPNCETDAANSDDTFKICKSTGGTPYMLGLITNASSTWTLNAIATITGPLAVSQTLNVTQGVTLPGLSTAVGTINGSICATTAGVLIYKAGANCF